MDVYARLADKMDSFPLGAPGGEKLTAILKELFSPEEAEAALVIPFNAVSLTQLAKDTGRKREELKAVCEGMAAKGLIYARSTARDDYYALLPVFPGIFELQFMTGGVGPVKTRLARMFEEYYVDGMGRAFTETETRFARVLPVEKEIPTAMEIFDFERISGFIDDMDYFALAVCYCRHEKGLLGEGCDAPKDVCMVFGPFARFTIERGFARKATRTEMMAALERSEAAGLVHVSDNVTDQINFLCNCCGCCCGFLRTITELGRANVVAASRFTARLDESECTECLTCTELCQVKAIRPAEDGLELDAVACLGCGACVTNCPSGALSLVERPDYRPPHANRRELNLSLLKDRGLVG